MKLRSLARDSPDLYGVANSMIYSLSNKRALKLGAVFVLNEALVLCCIFSCITEWVIRPIAYSCFRGVIMPEFSGFRRR